MRVGMDFRPAMGPRTGIGRYVAALSAELAGGGVDLRLYGVFLRGNRAARRRAPGGARLVAWPVPAILMDLLGTTGVLSADRVLGGCDLFHHTDYVLCRVNGSTRQVMTLHDLAFLRSPDWHTPQARYALTKLARRAAARCDGVCVPSRATARDCEERLGLSRDRVFVTPLGVDAPFYQVRRAPSRRPFFLAVGTIEPRKNHARLLRAFDSVARRNKEVRLLVAGKQGWGVEEARAAYDASSARDRIVFLGYTPEDELRRLLAEATAMVYPSLWEGFGLPVLEAMAAGCPVLTSDVAPLRETGGGAALFVDPLDTESIAAGMEALLDDGALRCKLAARGRKRARAHSWSRCADATRTAYEALCA